MEYYLKTLRLTVISLLLDCANTASILQAPNNSTVAQGDTVILKCKVHDIDDSLGQAVIWETGNPKSFISHNDVIVREQKSNRFSIVGNTTDGVYNLQISPVLAEDNGEYICSVFRENNIGVSVFLTVQYPPPEKYPQCYPLENKLKFTEIEMLSIVCKTGISYPPANTSWIDENGQVINDSTEILLGDEHVVTHKEVLYNYHDGATFTCSVSHSLWPEPRNCSLGPLYILFRPLTSISIQTTVADIRLLCVATGNPSNFSYEWTVFLGNQSTPHTNFKKIDIISKTNKLQLQRSDYYGEELVAECLAKNSQGVGRSNATILLSSSHCQRCKSKVIDICQTISVPTIVILVILLILSGLCICLLVLKIKKLQKTTTSEVSNVSSVVEMKRKSNNGVYVTLTESIDNLERI